MKKKLFGFVITSALALAVVAPATMPAYDEDYKGTGEYQYTKNSKPLKSGMFK